MSTPVFWFTGLSGAGKSTVCDLVRVRLEERGLRVLVLDGDDVRARLHRHLGFSPPEIEENNRLVAELCRTMRGDADVVLVPVISPFHRSRAGARAILAPDFYEIYFDAGLEVVRRRDVKGLYAKAARNEIADMVGVAPHVPFEPPPAPDLRLATGRETPAQSADRLLEFIVARL